MTTVADIFDYCRRKLPEGTNLYPYLNEAIQLVSKRLMKNRSNMVVGDLNQTVTSGGTSTTVPADFGGLIDRPYESGKTYVLEPLPDTETELSYQSTGTPYWYDIRGTTLKIIPGSTTSTTIKGKYWQIPTELTKVTDTIPYNGIFDTAIKQLILMQFKDGQDMAGMEAYANSKVDEIAPYIDKKEPHRFRPKDQFPLRR